MLFHYQIPFYTEDLDIIVSADSRENADKLFLEQSVNDRAMCGPVNGNKDNPSLFFMNCGETTIRFSSNPVCSECAENDI